MTTAKLPSAAFAAVFGRSPDAIGEAPGRVNLIGEHTDYSGGFALPLAIPQRTQVAVALTREPVVRAFTTATGERVSFALGLERRNGGWIDYVQGAVVALRARGFALSGFDAHIASRVPMGSGLSSSAALLVSLLRALREVFALPLDELELARTARQTENDFVGAPVGILDPMAVSFAGERSALFLDAKTLAYEHVPLPAALEILVVDSGVSHRHVGGEYAARRAEVEQAERLLGVRLLRDIDDAARADTLPEPLARRVRHVVSENARVRKVVECLAAADLEGLGELFNEAHRSLAEDFEVSTPEVDRLVALAQADPDVLGARLTGGGFGGAVVALVPRGRAEAAGLRLARAYGAGRVLVPGAPEP
jgi:galactokinase